MPRFANASARSFPAQASYGRRLVRLGAQLCAPDGTLINRDFERAWLPGHLQPQTAVTIPMRITAPDTPVPYSPPLEEFFLPKTSDIIRVARQLAAY